MLSRQMGDYFVYCPSNIFRNTHSQFRVNPGVSWNIFTHVTRLVQSRERKMLKDIITSDLSNLIYKTAKHSFCYLLRFAEQQQIYVFTVRRRFDGCHGNIRIGSVCRRDFSWGIILDWRCYQHVLILFYKYTVYISLQIACLNSALVQLTTSLPPGSYVPGSAFERDQVSS